MNLESIGIAVTILLGVAGASIKIIELIVHQSTAKILDEIRDDIETDIKTSNKRINRLERRTAILETKVHGDSDSFGHD